MSTKPIDSCWLCGEPEYYHYECRYFPCRCTDGAPPCVWCVAFSDAMKVNGTDAEKRAIVIALAKEHEEYWPRAYGAIQS